jgi:hypothetical protein
MDSKIPIANPPVLRTAIRIYLCHIVWFYVQMCVFGGILLDSLTILPSGIYECMFVNIVNLRALRANRRVCKIQTFVRISLPYWMCLYIDIYEWKDVPKCMDNDLWWYLGTRVCKFPTTLCAFGENGYMNDIRTYVHNILNGIFMSARLYITTIFFVPMTTYI